MKTMKNLIGIMLLMVSMTVSAQESPDPVDSEAQDEQAITQDGLDAQEVVVNISDFTGGAVVVKEKKDQDITVTVTPAKGYFIEKSDMTVYAVKDPAKLTRSDDGTIPVGPALELTGDDPDDLTQPRDYTFTVPEGLGAWVYGADFHEVDKPVTSGKLSADVLWEVTSDETATTLTLSGDGTAELLAKADAPWNTFASDITSLVVEDGIQELGDGLLASCPALATITLKGKKVIGLGDNTLTKDITVDVYGLIYNEYKADKNWGVATIFSSDGVEMKGVAFGKGNDYDLFVSHQALLVPTKLLAFVVTAIDGSNVKIEEITDGIIPADVPVLLLSKDLDDDDFRTVTTDEKGTAEAGLLKAAGSGGQYVDLGGAYLLYNDVFYLSQEGTIPEGGVYIPVSDGKEEQGGEKPKEELRKTRSFLTIGDDGTTAIDASRLSPLTSHHSDAWYSLDGRRLNTAPTRKGIYVNKGKVVMIK